MSEGWEKNYQARSFDLKNTEYPYDIYLFKVNNWNTRTMSEISSKLTTKKPEPCE